MNQTQLDQLHLFLETHLNQVEQCTNTHLLQLLQSYRHSRNPHFLFDAYITTLERQINDQIEYQQEPKSFTNVKITIINQDEQKENDTHHADSLSVSHMQLKDNELSSTEQHANISDTREEKNPKKKQRAKPNKKDPEPVKKIKQEIPLQDNNQQERRQTRMSTRQQTNKENINQDINRKRYVYEDSEDESECDVSSESNQDSEYVNESESFSKSESQAFIKQQKKELDKKQKKIKAQENNDHFMNYIADIFNF